MKICRKATENAISSGETSFLDLLPKNFGSKLALEKVIDYRSRKTIYGEPDQLSKCPYNFRLTYSYDEKTCAILFNELDFSLKLQVRLQKTSVTLPIKLN